MALVGQNIENGQRLTSPQPPGANRMFRAYFGDLRTGRLARLPFLGFLLLLSVLFVLYGLGTAFGVGLVEQVIRIDLSAAPGGLLEQIDGAALALPGPLLLVLVLVLVFGFAKTNLLAKRIRDMGLPGWWTLLVIALAGAGLGSAMHASGVPLHESYAIHGMISGLLALGLLLIPSGLFHPPGSRRPPCSALLTPTDPTGTDWLASREHHEPARDINPIGHF